MLYRFHKKRYTYQNHSVLFYQNHDSREGASPDPSRQTLILHPLEAGDGSLGSLINSYTDGRKRRTTDNLEQQQ